MSYPVLRTTSTYRQNSLESNIGENAERIVMRELNSVCAPWTVIERNVVNASDPKSIWGNSRDGDLRVVIRGQLSHTIEVKSSLKYPNASIDERELTESNARFLVALTRAGLWACTMEEARANALLHGSYGSSFWVVRHSDVLKVPLQTVVL